MARIRQALEERGMLDRAIIFSFLPKQIRAAQKHCPSIPALLLIDPPRGSAIYSAGTIERAVASGATLLGLRGSAITPDLVDKAHAHELPVFVYTVDDPAVVDAMVKARVDGIITNKPRATHTRIVVGGRASNQREHADESKHADGH